MHLIIFPISYIRLSIWKHKNTFSLFKRFLIKLISRNRTTHIFRIHLFPNITKSMICNNRIIVLEYIQFLIILKRIRFTKMKKFSLSSNFWINHTIQIIFMSRFLRFFFKQRPITRIHLINLIINIFFNQGNFYMFSQLIFFLKNIK